MLKKKIRYKQFWQDSQKIVELFIIKCTLIIIIGNYDIFSVLFYDILYLIDCECYFLLFSPCFLCCSINPIPIFKTA